MAERGGPTLQAGILYQNSVTALYLGRLCDSTPRPDLERVILVRTEAPEDVDDTVVTFADNHRTYIQAKENVREDHLAWTKLWLDFDAQFHRKDFQRGSDRLLLHVGETHDQHQELRELCERARHSGNQPEWWNRLTKPQKEQAQRIASLIRPESLDETELWELCSHIDVEIWSLTQIERDLIPYWMPQSNELPAKLFHLLRDRVGGEARYRGSFTSAALRESLELEGVKFATPTDIDDLRHCIRQCGALLRLHKHTIGNTGRHLRRPVVDDIVAWAQEASGEERVAMLLDQAGMGKTVVLRDVLCELDDLGVPTLALKADQQLSNVSTSAELQSQLGLPDSVEHIVGRLASLGPVVVLIDQIDALSLSLARDQKALDIVLDVLARLRLIPNVRIVLSCRIFDYNSDPRLRRVEIRKRFALAELLEEDVQEVLQVLGVDLEMLSQVTQKLVRTPLHLDIFVRAMEELDSQAGGVHNMQGVASLQELYAHLWRNIVLKPVPGGPSRLEREETLRVIIDYMDSNQKTTAPLSLFSAGRSGFLDHSADWLASEGILIASTAGWTLIHQTFFDYCYARQFVNSGRSLTEAILSSEQCLFQRPKLVHVLAYLRANSRAQYLQELHSLFSTSDLRFHLRDLLFRWFGSLQDPASDEWPLAHRMLTDPIVRPRFLRAVYGNRAWFGLLNGRPIRDLMAEDDRTLDTQVVPYLGSLFDLQATQAEIVSLVRPHLGSSPEWNNRIAWMLLHTRGWHTSEAVDLLEQTVHLMPTFELDHFFQLDDIARAYPQSACRLIRLMLDRTVERYLHKSQTETGLYHHSLHSELGSLDSSTLKDALRTVSQVAPKCCLDSLLPWVEQVIQLRNEPTSEGPSFVSDDLSYGWYEDASVARSTIIDSLISAVTFLARTNPEEFRSTAARLAVLPYLTPQLLLARVYRALPELYAEDALRFLMADQQRLALGDRQQYDSRQLIKSIYPFLTSDQKAETEASILTYTPVRKYLGTEGLRRRGLEQLCLLQAIPDGYLSERGLRQLRELERKFPGFTASETPIVGQGGFVGSPISPDSAKKMSDRAWLRAMQKYHGSVEHKEFLKGGARELAGVLSEEVREHPCRFYCLIDQVPDNLDDSYVEAFLDGLAASEAPAAWLFDVIRRFAPQPGRNIMRTVARTLENYARYVVPDDLLALLENCVRGPMNDDEVWWEQQREDLHNGYINTDRGSSLRALMRALRCREADEAKLQRWDLVEYVATDPSLTLCVGAIHELLFLLSDDRERAISAFELLMNGRPRLLHSFQAQEFLYYALYKHFGRLKPFIRASMDSSEEQCQQRGAELACIAAISPLVLEGPEICLEAQELANEAVAGIAAWRRGAARIYAHNISRGFSDECSQQLRILLDDDDAEVQRLISSAFHLFRGEHIQTLRRFIEDFAASRSLHAGMHEFTELLWEYGSLDPSWTLSVITIILGNQPRGEEELRWQPSGEKLIRLVLRIHNDPVADNALRSLAMDAFDRLMERYAGQAQKVLSEWDTR